jgi:hypothetical protein
MLRGELPAVNGERGALWKQAEKLSFEDEG